MAGFKKFWDALGLSETDNYDYDNYDEAPVNAPARGARPGYSQPSYPPAQPGGFGPYGNGGYPSNDEPSSNVRALPIIPADGGVGAVTVQPRTPGANPTSSVTVRAIPAPASPKVHLVAPTSFGDAQEIGERFRGGQPVIVNLGAVERDLKRRLVDFASGLIYGLNGEMQRVGESVFMLTPKNVEVSADEKRKLQERGLLAP